jgi:cytochrome P450
VIADLLGIPREDSDLLVTWGDAIALNLHGTAALEEAAAAVDGIDAYLARMLEETRAGRPPTTLFAALLEAAERDGPGRLRATFTEMQIGGYETTRSLLSGGLVELLARPDQWRILADDPSLATQAVEEILRFVSPGLWTARVPLVETEIGGVAVSPADTVMNLIGASNRDPEVFERPDELDILRPNARAHLAFSFGPHYCLGQALARLEAKVFFEMLATRFPHATLAEDHVRREGHANNRRVPSLRIRVGSAS